MRAGLVAHGRNISHQVPFVLHFSSFLHQSMPFFNSTSDSSTHVRELGETYIESLGFSKQSTSSNGTVFYRCRLRSRFHCNALMKLSPNNMPGEHNWIMHRILFHHHVASEEDFSRGLPTHIKGVPLPPAPQSPSGLTHPSPILLSTHPPLTELPSPMYPTHLPLTKGEKFCGYSSVGTNIMAGWLARFFFMFVHYVIYFTLRPFYIS